MWMLSEKQAVRQFATVPIMDRRQRSHWQPPKPKGLPS